MIEFRLRHFAETPSTNDEARKAAQTDEPEGLVIWAQMQTAGRGRQGRTWESPEGNLYCSVLLRPQTGQRQIGLYSFVASMAVYDTVRQCLPVADIALKWPNDVLVEGGKIAGLLLETEGNALIVGVGLNLLHHPAEGLYPSTSVLAACGGAREAADVLPLLLLNLGHWYGVMQKDGFGPVREAWLKRARRGPLTVRLPDEEIQGEFAGIDENGGLRLRLADGTERAIATGDVFF